MMRRPRGTATGLLALLLMTTSGAARGQVGDVEARLDALEREHPQHAAVSRIGISREGAAISVVRLGSTVEGGDPAARPAVLVVAGIDGRHTVGTQVALGLAEALAEDHAELLESATVYVVPRVNPDGMRRGIAGVLVPEDDDRDGRVDEDAPQDLDGDGFVTMMRVADPPPGMSRTHAPDADEPRLMIAADPSKGIRATHALLVEARDADGDGRFGEDGEGETSLDRNFPHQWPEVGAGIGRYPMSEPESRALADWMLARHNIGAVIVFGRHDTIATVPAAGKYDSTKKAPLGIEKKDEPYYSAMRELFREITGQTGAAEVNADGSFHAWAYAQFGVPTFATTVWARPDRVERPTGAGASEDAGGPASGEATAAAGRGGADRKAGSRTRKAGDDPLADERAWLQYSDAERRGDLFVEWTPFDHPQLGAVEIGGFVPGHQMSAPVAEIGRLVAEQTQFLVAVADRLPELKVEPPRVERVGTGVYRVRVAVVNDGFLPTTSAIGVKVRRLTPLVLRIDVPEHRVVAGEPVVRHPVIEGSGGRAEGSWLITGDAGSKVSVVLSTSLIGEHVIDLTLDETTSSDSSSGGDSSDSGGVR